jgi:hypothetical protein
MKGIEGIRKIPFITFIPVENLSDPCHPRKSAANCSSACFRLSYCVLTFSNVNSNAELSRINRIVRAKQKAATPGLHAPHQNLAGSKTKIRRPFFG